MPHMMAHFYAIQLLKRRRARVAEMLYASHASAFTAMPRRRLFEPPLRARHAARMPRVLMAFAIALAPALCRHDIYFTVLSRVISSPRLLI